MNKNTTAVLDEATTTFLDSFSKFFMSIATLPIPEQREAIKSIFRSEQHQLESIAKAENKTISGRHGPIAIRIFSPKKTGALPVIVYIHRGGWVYGSIEESEIVCRRLATAAGTIVVAVEYRLAPENKFPIPLEDCCDATQWVYENASQFSGDQKKVILCGESAGGNLAAAVALMLKGSKCKIAGQMLLYPVLTNDLNKKFYEESPDKSLLSYPNMQFFWDAYLATSSDGDNPYASPLKGRDAAGLPPCLIVNAEHDALKHEGNQYGELLRRAGVPTQVLSYSGVIHGFLDLPLAEETQAKALHDIAQWIRHLLEN